MADISLTAAMRSNLLSLQSTSKLLDQTQGRLSTGLKVNTPLDNPANYFAASGMRLRAGDLTGLKDGMGNAVQTIKASTNAIQGIQSLLNTAKGLIESARTATASDRADLADQYDEVMKQINRIVDDSDFQGTTFLGSSNGTSLTLDVTFDNRSGHSSSSKLTIAGFQAYFSLLGSSGVSSAGTTWSANSAANLTSVLNSTGKEISRALSYLEKNSATLAANLAIISARLDFTDNMVNTLKEGSDKLTLADMNEESANMLALQTRQNLGITSLSLASQANQSILRLF